MDRSDALDDLVGNRHVGIHILDLADLGGGDLVDNGHIVARDDRRGVFLHLAVALHHVGLQLLGRRRRPNDGVGAGGDGLTDALGRLAARCDERQVGIVLAQLAQDLGRVLAGRDVEDLGSGAHFGVSIVVATYDRGDDGDVGDVGDVLDHFGSSRGVDHTARRALHLGDGCHLYGALTGRSSAAHAYKDRALGNGQQRLRNGRLWREGVNGKDGIGVGVADDRDVGGVDKRLDATTEERKAAGLLDLIGHAESRLAQTPVDGQRLHGQKAVGSYGHLGLGKFVCKFYLGEVDRGDNVLVNLGGNIDGGLVVCRD